MYSHTAYIVFNIKVFTMFRFLSIFDSKCSTNDTLEELKLNFLHIISFIMDAQLFIFGYLISILISWYSVTKHIIVHS